MKKSDLFDLGLKLFGVYFLIQALIATKDLLLVLQIESTMNSIPFGPDTGMSMWGAYSINIGIQLLFSLLLIFQSQYLTRKLIKGEDENSPELKADRTFAFQLACVVVGGFLITDAVAALGHQLINLVSYMRMNAEPMPGTIPDMIWRAILAIGGYTLITVSGTVARYFARKSQDSAPSE